MSLELIIQIPLSAIAMGLVLGITWALLFSPLDIR